MRIKTRNLKGSHSIISYESFRVRKRKRKGRGRADFGGYSLERVALRRVRCRHRHCGHSSRYYNAIVIGMEIVPHMQSAIHRTERRNNARSTCGAASNRKPAHDRPLPVWFRESKEEERGLFHPLVPNRFRMALVPFPTAKR